MSQTGETFARPSREIVLDWVLEAWELVPVDLVQRGMQQLIVDHALHPCTVPAPAPAPALIDLAADAEDDSRVLSVLDTLGENDVVRTTEADEATDDDPDYATEVAPPSACIRCERPLRTGNMVSCDLCGASFHTGCMTTNSAGKCMFCA